MTSRRLTNKEALPTSGRLSSSPNSLSIRNHGRGKNGNSSSRSPPPSLFRVVFLGDLHIRSSDVVFHFRTQKNCGRPVIMESGFFGKTINTCNLQRRPLYRCAQNRFERY